MQPTEPVVVTWQRSASWTEALRPLELPFMYVAAWTLLLSRSEHLRKTVANKNQKNLRQGLSLLEHGGGLYCWH